MEEDYNLGGSKEWQPILEALIKNKDYQWKTTSIIKQLVRYIEDEYEEYIHEVDDLQKPFVVTILPTEDFYNPGLQDENVWKFIASLKVQEIISDVNLPVRIRRRNQKSIQISGLPIYLDSDDLLKNALREPEELKKSLVSFSIPDWSKFEVIKDKIYLDKQELALEKKTGDVVIIEPVDLDIALAELKEVVVKFQFSDDWVFGDIELGTVKDGMKGEETQRKLQVAELLKSEGVIESYDVKERHDTILFKDMDTNKAEELPFATFVARCKFKPKKVFGFMKEQWQPKYQQIQQIADLYLKLIKIVEAYFKLSAHPDVQLNNYYIQLDRQIIQLLNRAPLPVLRVDYSKPFSDLLSANKEMERSNISLQSHLNNMYAYYGTLQDFLISYTVGKPNVDIVGLDKYLNNINTIKEADNVQIANNTVSGKSYSAISKYSDANLKKIGRVCDLITDEIEIQNTDSSLKLVKIKFDRFQEKNMSPAEGLRIMKVINEICGEQIVVPKNDEIKVLKIEPFSSKYKGVIKIETPHYAFDRALEEYGIDESDLHFYILVEYKGQDMEAVLYGLKSTIEQKVEHKVKAVRKDENLPEQSTSSRKADSRVTLYVTEDYGIFLDPETRKPNYAIKGKKRRRLLNTLNEHNKVEGKVLVELLGQALPLISKEIGEINELFKRNLHLPDDLIVRVETGGYKLNKEKFNILVEDNF